MRRQFCALVSVGCSMRRAAKYVGVRHGTIRYNVLNDRQFAAMVRQAEMNREVAHIQNVRAAGARSWRASAWMLERLNPDDFRIRPPETVTVADVKSFLEGIGQVIATVIPTRELQKGVLAKLKALFRKR
ncbi:MAG TPA: hypothetical protein VHV77_08225 [Pirellulales bacterium]|nr:hypothetical protein [Pirellulales bacterium]